jgi:hypothetical protein
MKTLRGVWIAVAVAWLPGATGAQGQVLDLNGYWKSDAEGTVRINHDLNTGYVLIEGAPCPNGANRPFILSGSLEGETLTGSMWRCTNQELIDKCGHPRIYQVRFVATASLDPFTDFFRNGEIKLDRMKIDAKWLMEFHVVEDCKEKRKEDQADLYFISRSKPQAPTPRTSPGTAPPPFEEACGYAHFGSCEYRTCLWTRFGYGSPPNCE